MNGSNPALANSQRRLDMSGFHGDLDCRLSTANGQLLTAGSRFHSAACSALRKSGPPLERRNS